MHFAKISTSPHSHNCIELSCQHQHSLAVDQRKNESPLSPIHGRALNSFPSLPSFTHPLSALPHQSSASTPQRLQLPAPHTDSPKMRKFATDTASPKAIFGIKLRKASQNNIIAEKEESEAELQDLCSRQNLQNLQDTPGKVAKLKERKGSCNLDFATLFQKGRKNSQNSMGMVKSNRREQGQARKNGNGWDENNNFQFTNNLNSDETHYSNDSSPLPEIPKLKNLRKQSQNQSPKKQFPSFLNGFKSHRNSIDPVEMAKQYSRFGIQNFLIVRDLGKGTFGRVVLVMQRQSRALVAIKIMSKREIRDSNMVEQLIREIKIQQYACHPNVVKVYGFFDDLLHFYIIMECELDAPLSQTIKNRSNPISDCEAANTISQICQAIAYLHSQSIIHRDLKPDNVLFHEGVVKISDFGWSVHRDGRLRSTFCGTPVYLCPEILVGDNYDQSVDIWTIGVILYQLYCKSNPFRITCREELVNIVNQPIYFDEKVQIPPAAKDFITVCLAKRAADRPNIRQLLLHEFLLKAVSVEQLKR